MSEVLAPIRTGHRESPAATDADALIVGQDDLDALFPLIISLPDGRVVAIEALIAAVTAGDESVPDVHGAAVSVELLVELLTKEFGKSGTAEDTLLGEGDGQASFRDGMNLAMLNSLFENGRIGYSDESATPLKTIRRAKDKPAGKDELQEVLVDGPDAGDDIIRPPSRGPIVEDFIERVRDNKTSPDFEITQASGNLFMNDSAGANGFGAIMSVEYKNVVYRSQGSQLIVEEPGIWRLTINLTGTPGQPETGYGLYFFEQIATFDHSKVPGGEIANFSLTYTVEDIAGNRDTAAITFVIVDSDPDAKDDGAAAIQNHISSGNVSDNDAIGADAPGGILKVGTGDQTFLADEADGDGRVTLAGAYGVLVFDFDDGSYDYYCQEDVLEGDPEEVTDEFYYAIADSDGDEDSAVLRFYITAGDVLPGEAEIGNPGSEDDEERTEGITYVWADLSAIDSDFNSKVDGTDTIKGFQPDIDRLDIDGLLGDLGYDDAASASDVFRLVGSDGSIDLQINLGLGWQTFANVSNTPPLTFQEVEAAIIA